MNLNLDIFKIKSNNVAPEKGKILIAEPFLHGSYFNRSIVYLVEHNNNGSVGFILNKPVDFQINEFHKEFPNYTDNIYIGGPVNIESLFFIHKLGNKIRGSIQIVDGLWWGGDFDDLKKLMNEGKINNSQIRFFLGYSGWDKSQLNEELKEDSWIVSDITPNLVINGSNELWHDMVKSLGGKYRLWENFPENPGMN